MSTPALALVAAPVFGIAVGSFTNVIIDRIPVALDEPNEFGELWDTRPWGEVLGGTSRCSTCATPIRPSDNIPVLSYLALRGKCRGCGERIPAFHPFVELLVPLLALLAVWRIGVHPELIAVLWFIPAGVAISVIDFNTLIVPTRLVWPTFAVSVAVTVGISAYRGDWSPLIGSCVGVGVLAGPLFVIWWFHPRGMGMGDVRLAVLIGWNVGFAAMLAVDRPMAAVMLTIIMLVVSSVLGIVVGLALQVGLGRQLPFGPALVGGALVCMLLAEPILRPFF